MPTRKRSTSALGLAALIAAVLGLTAIGFALVAQSQESSGVTEPITVFSSPSYAYDFRDDDILVGFSDVVFLGEVLELVGTQGRKFDVPDQAKSDSKGDEANDEIPETQFSVKVLQTIKGSLPEHVVVNQSGGINKATGHLNLVEGDSLLKAGETAVFFAVFEPEFDWYTLVAGPYSAVRTKDAADSQALIARFEEAKQTQFVPDSGPQVDSAEDGREPRKREDKDRKNRRHNK